ncbi:MAG: NAD(P)-dependent oxidoreductase [Eubacteriales bacterium]|nr:NAD(P)-dependent oxidoreductase [Eubacteriales bacterium]
MTKVAWIGTGVMGGPMACHLQKKGYQVYAYNRSTEKAQALAAQGVIPCDTIAQAVTDADFVFTIVGYPKDVEQVYLGEGGVFSAVKPGAVAVDMTTSSPELAKRLYAAGQEIGVSVLDAPVSGGDKGAKNAALSIMVGGDEDAFEKTKPLFACMGTSILLMGGPGAGQHTKACNQICVAGATAAYTEALAYAIKVGLDPEKMLAAISGGAAGSWQLNNMAPRALHGDHAPGFYVKHFVKDMLIARDVAAQQGLELPMLDTVLAEYQQMAENGLADAGTQALIRRYLPEYPHK